MMWEVNFRVFYKWLIFNLWLYSVKSFFMLNFQKCTCELDRSYRQVALHALSFYMTWAQTPPPQVPHELIEYCDCLQTNWIQNKNFLFFVNLVQLIMKLISSLTVEYHENGFKSCRIDHWENLYSFQLQKFIGIFLARTFLFKSLSHFKIRQLLLILSHVFSKFLSNCYMTDIWHYLKESL